MVIRPIRIRFPKDFEKRTKSEGEDRKFSSRIYLIQANVIKSTDTHVRTGGKADLSLRFSFGHFWFVKNKGGEKTQFVEPRLLKWSQKSFMRIHLFTYF